ncbi:hypothetical protein EI94DRAFT_997730 [Lactarius quietus]|nr:hypothetical protein EI94DRAFT_997730 [Lactarius quietus]
MTTTARGSWNPRVASQKIRVGPSLSKPHEMADKGLGATQTSPSVLRGRALQPTRREEMVRYCRLPLYTILKTRSGCDRHGACFDDGVPFMTRRIFSSLPPTCHWPLCTLCRRCVRLVIGIYNRISSSRVLRELAPSAQGGIDLFQQRGDIEEASRVVRPGANSLQYFHSR